MSDVPVATPDSGEPSEAATIPQKIEFHYLKSHLFRVVHADGVVGGPSPAGKITLNIFSERIPIPKRQVFQLSPEGKLEGELEGEREARSGIVREVEVGLTLDVAVAKNLVQWLVNAIAQAEKARATAETVLAKGAPR